MSTKNKGLLLCLGGAPNTAHVVEGLPGYYSPTVPHMVGDDLTIEMARKAVKDHPDLLELVDVSVGDANEAEDEHAAFVEEGRGALREARHEGRTADDPSRTEDENNALKEA